RVLQKWRAGGERGEICHRHSRDFRQCFLSKKSLVRGDEHIGKGKEARQFVILQDLSGQIFKENALLFFVHVESHTAESTGFQRRDQRFSVDKRAAADVDQDRARLHQLKRF